MNIVVPGTGLIVLGRHWLGIAIAVWFALGAEVALFGILVAPATIPSVAIVVAALLAGGAWLLAQARLIARIRFLRDPNLPREMAILRRFARHALGREDYKAARAALLIARSVDDTDLPTRILWAKLLSATGNQARARRAWLYAARLDSDKMFAAEIQDALDRLQTA